MRLTEGHLARHYQGRRGGRGPSLLDIAQDHGYLTQPVDVPAWLATVQRRFAFLADLDADEQRWSACNPGHRHEIETIGLAGFNS